MKVLDSDWSNVTVDVDNFDCAGSNEIAFQADDDATIADAVGVTESGAVIDDAGVQTGESGEDAITNSLWLKLASIMSATTQQSGTIYYMIANGI